MSLKWDEAAMATGVAEVDQQHQKLIDHLNELFRLMREGHGKEGIDSFVDFLTDYADTHFRHEEGCMTAYRCPVAAANKIQHMQFMRLLGGYRKRLQDEGPTGSLAIEVQHTVGEWIRNHIIKTDTHLRSCVKAASA